MRGTWGFAVLIFFYAVNKISICGVAVISNLMVCDGDRVSSTFLAVKRCSLNFFAVFSPPPHQCPVEVMGKEKAMHGEALYFVHSDLDMYS